MNTGIVSSRYAKALLAFVDSTGNGQQVYEQALLLEKCIMKIEEMKIMVTNPKMTTDRKKMQIFSLACGGKDVIAPEMVSFLSLVMKNRRTNYLPIMLRAFIARYRAANNIHVGKLTVAVPSEELASILTERGHAKTGGEVLIETEVDPSIIGGFIFEMEDRRLDASVASRLKSVKRQYIEKNRRIV
ncbi:MAG: ATP synthase F1 subunit delta [Bacteroidales bacterium]|nr:ATP synthase F1 subunit delta [Bacteroidales bacterium]